MYGRWIVWTGGPGLGKGVVWGMPGGHSFNKEPVMVVVKLGK